jgi:aquaporin Z
VKDAVNNTGPFSTPRAVSARDALGVTASLRLHWPEYLMETGEISLFMFCTCSFATLTATPGFPGQAFFHQRHRPPCANGIGHRRYSHGAHHESMGQEIRRAYQPRHDVRVLPAGKLRPWDALFYGVAQFSGATVGVALATFLLRGAPGHDTVRYAVTAPGVYGAAVAFAAELAISFILMITVLLVTNHERLARYTPYFVGSLYAVYIAFETPLSGMSMNPARTFGPAAYGGYWHALWIYFIAPTVGMLAAAETFLRIRRGVAPYCAKLHHANHERCIFHHTPEVPKRFTQSARGQESGPVQPPPARMVEESQRSAGGSSEFDVGKKARAQNWQELRRLLNVSN